MIYAVVWGWSGVLAGVCFLGFASLFFLGWLRTLLSCDRMHTRYAAATALAAARNATAHKVRQ